MGTRIGANTSNSTGGEGDFENITQTTLGTKSALDVSVISSGSAAAFIPWQTDEDTNFVAGDSPHDVDCNTDLGANSRSGYIVCDGPGNILVASSEDGVVFGDNATVKPTERIRWDDVNIDTVRVTHSGTDSAYRSAYS